MLLRTMIANVHFNGKLRLAHDGVPQMADRFDDD